MEDVTNGTQEAAAADPAGENTSAVDPASAEAKPAEDPAGDPAKAAEDPAADPESQKQQNEEPADPKETKDIAAEQQKKAEELNQREQDLNRRELEMEVRGILQEKSISEGMLPFLMRGSREETIQCIDAYKKAADADLKIRLDALMVGKPPKDNAGSVTTGDKTNAAVFASALRG